MWREPEVDYPVSLDFARVLESRGVTTGMPADLLYYREFGVENEGEAAALREMIARLEKLQFEVNELKKQQRTYRRRPMELL